MILPLLALLSGCDRRADDLSLEPAILELGPEQMCLDPAPETTAAERLVEVGAARGLDALVVVPEVEARSCPSIPGGVVAHDLDGDGDVDLAFSKPSGLPDLFENDGAGHFTLHRLSGTLDPLDRVEAAAAVDLDGDDLPELLIAGWGHVSVAWNRGELRFSALEPLYYEDSYPRSCIMSLAVGDVDGDGDLDLAIPGADEIDEAGAPMVGPSLLLDGRPDRLLLQLRGEFVEADVFSAEPEPQIALVAAFTDVDVDGDLDLLFTTDRPWELPTNQLHVNEGLDDRGWPAFSDGTESTGFATRPSAMGMVSFDQNGDGRLDYCVSDHAPALQCLLSEPTGSRHEAGRSLGLTAPHAQHPDLPEDTDEVELDEMMDYWATWSLELLDLDNDGNDELAAASGIVPHMGDPGLAPYQPIEPDVIYQGLEHGGFEEVGHLADFGRVEDHYGLASADLDGDGFRELVVGTWEGSPLLWDNPCGEGSWVELDFIGTEKNRQGFGARVELEAGGRTWMRELHGLRGVGQSDSALHFGLGELEQIDRLVVTWPDGSQQEATDLPTRRVITLIHPSAPEAAR